MQQHATRPASESLRLSVDEARNRIFQDCKLAVGKQCLSVRESLDRILADSVISTMNVPAHTNSAVDGYAIHHSDIPSQGEESLKVIGKAFAGEPFSGPLHSGQTIRIMTGAVMPNGADTVIMQEHVTLDGEKIIFNHEHRAGENVRLAGEDLAIGDIALPAGRRLYPSDLGLLASLGFSEVTAYRRLRVAYFSTGDELRNPGQNLQPGQIYDSNRYTLLGLLQQAGVEPVDMGIVADTPDALRHTLLTAADEADVIITSGGVSVGDADYMREVMQQIGNMNFWQIAMKPGRPLAYGRIAKTPLFGLPGNPVAVMVTFYEFVKPALQRLAGISDPALPPQFRVRSSSEFRKRSGRTEYQRAVLYFENGEWLVRSFGKQGSGILRSMSEANCLVVLPDASESIDVGDWVEVQPMAVLRD